MTTDRDLSLAGRFANLPDPRIDRTKKHVLGDILIIALCAVIAGGDSWEEVERFGQAKVDWLKRFLALPNGIPSHDTFNRVFARIDPKAFAECVARWIDGVCEATALRHITIDGKSARSAPRASFCGCLHLVGAWATENRLILGQEAVADSSHEIAAILELLRMLDLKGVLVTLDAAGCQTAIARQIRAGAATTCWPSRGTSRRCTRRSRPPSRARARPTSPGSSMTAMGRSRTGTGGTRSGTRP